MKASFFWEVGDYLLIKNIPQADLHLPYIINTHSCAIGICLKLIIHRTKAVNRFAVSINVSELKRAGVYNRFANAPFIVEQVAKIEYVHSEL